MKIFGELRILDGSGDGNLGGGGLGEGINRVDTDWDFAQGCQRFRDMEILWKIA